MSCKLIYKVFLLLVTVLLITGCGRDGRLEPIVERQSEEPTSTAFPMLATKNSSRLPGKDPIENAVFAAQTVYPSTSRSERPRAVTLVDRKSWQDAVVSSLLVQRAIRAPILLTDGEDVPQITKSSISILKPTGIELGKGKRTEKLKAFQIGSAGKVGGLATRSLKAKTPAATADGIDKLATAITGKTSRAVVVVSQSDSSSALPAAAWAAKSGNPVLFVKKRSIPSATVAALKRRKKPQIYVLAPKRLVSTKVTDKLKKYGAVTRIAAGDAVKSSINFARYYSGGFGWGVVDPGHGLVFVNRKRPLDVAAAAPLATAGKFGPLLLVNSANRLPKATKGYLLDIQPGYRVDPVRGLYNHAWLIGDESALSVGLQSEIDRLSEIKRLSQRR